LLSAKLSEKRRYFGFAEIIVSGLLIGIRKLNVMFLSEVINNKRVVQKKIDLITTGYNRKTIGV
jgi:hypothetical protein